jgi:hypothetical protein
MTHFSPLATSVHKTNFFHSKENQSYSKSYSRVNTAIERCALPAYDPCPLAVAQIRTLSCPEDFTSGLVRKMF